MKIKFIVALSVALGAAPASAQTCKPLRAESDVAGVRLADAASATNVFGNTERKRFQEKDASGADRDFAFVRFLNRDGSQEARFYIHYGDAVGSYNEIEVMPATPNSMQSHRLARDTLATERGVKLGITMTELIRLLGPCHTREQLPNGAMRISYTIEDESHALLKRSKMPSYFGRYDFRMGRLERFRIGFDYP